MHHGGGVAAVFGGDRQGVGFGGQAGQIQRAAEVGGRGVHELQLAQAGGGRHRAGLVAGGGAAQLQAAVDQSAVDRCGDSQAGFVVHGHGHGDRLAAALAVDGFDDHAVVARARCSGVHGEAVKVVGRAKAAAGVGLAQAGLGGAVKSGFHARNAVGRTGAYVHVDGAGGCADAGGQGQIHVGHLHRAPHVGVRIGAGLDAGNDQVLFVGFAAGVPVDRVACTGRALTNEPGVDVPAHAGVLVAALDRQLHRARDGLGGVHGNLRGGAGHADGDARLLLRGGQSDRLTGGGLGLHPEGGGLRDRALPVQYGAVAARTADGFYRGEATACTLGLHRVLRALGKGVFPAQAGHLGFGREAGGQLSRCGQRGGGLCVAVV